MKILFATDGSESALNALEFLLRFPFPRNSTVTLMMVTDPIPMSSKEVAGLSQKLKQALEDANMALHDTAKQLVIDQCERLRAHGWLCETIVRSGDPADEILCVAKELEADLLVLGSHGESGFKRLLLGSVSEQVLESALCSVLIVRPKLGNGEPAKTATVSDTGSGCRILLAYDNSDAAQRALKVCASLPLKEDSEVRVLGVLPLITAYRQDIRQHLNVIWQQKKRAFQAGLEEAAALLEQTTSNVKAELREGSSVGDVILESAANTKSDLIMFGHEKKSVFDRFLHGSVVHRIARYAPCSVWAVRGKSKRPA